MADGGNAPLATITNVVAAVDLGCPIDLKQLYDTIKILLSAFIQYDEVSEVITLHVPHTKAFGRIFRTGKMTCQGEISDEGCIQAVRKIVRLVQQMGCPDVELKTFEIVNVCGELLVECQVNLVDLKDALGEPNCTYDAVSHVLNFKMEQPEVTLSIFESGKVKLKGAKSDQQVFDACEKIFFVLEKFKRPRTEGALKRKLND